MRFDFNDIFSITQPNEYNCRVQRYNMTDAQSFMYVFVYPDSDLRNYFAIYFSFVRYYSGPMAWHGANFRLAPYTDCVNLLRRITGFQEYPSEEEAKVSGLISRDQHYKMYLSGSNELGVSIVALHAEILQADQL